MTFEWLSKPGSAAINSIEIDSRQVREGSLFIAVKGHRFDGHDFIDSAIKNGAAAILVETVPEILPKADVLIIRVENSRKITGAIAAAFYDHPSSRVTLIGVTGTNGKTSVATMLHQLLGLEGHTAGLISTIENKIGDQVLPSSLTTPDPISLQRLLAEMVHNDCSSAVMEVSSHALDQHRTSGCDFKLAIFTNITHDHLDYHGTFDAYLGAKKSFFDGLGPESSALINLDDRNGKVLIQNTRATVHTYALKKPADFKARILDSSVSGLQLDLEGWEVHCRLIGRFNAYNLLAVYSAARLLGVDQTVALQHLSQVQAPRGRFQTIRGTGKEVTGVVDYAHTPDALKNVLQTLQQIKPKDSRIITLVGCGGDRDRRKRPKMAQIAEAYSDLVILTSDNPRSENPESILRDMLEGLDQQKRKKVISIADRREAMKTSYQLAHNKDVILVAGKGHEPYQEINGNRIPFDDAREIKQIMDET